MMTTTLARAASATFLLVVGAACARNDAAVTDSMATATPPMPAAAAVVSTIELGRQLGPNNRVTDATTVFAPRDTVYLVVVTDNTTPTSNLTARWTFEGGQVVDSTSQPVARSDAADTQAVTEFHISKPDGWPVGRYTVDILLDGASVGTREFEVRN